MGLVLRDWRGCLGGRNEGVRSTGAVSRAGLQVQEFAWGDLIGEQRLVGKSILLRLALARYPDQNVVGIAGKCKQPALEVVERAFYVEAPNAECCLPALGEVVAE